MINILHGLGLRLLALGHHTPFMVSFSLTNVVQFTLVLHIFLTLDSPIFLRGYSPICHTNQGSHVCFIHKVACQISHPHCTFLFQSQLPMHKAHAFSKIIHLLM